MTTNERNTMETTGINYNPHQMVELRKIVNGESTFAYYKATELEEMLFANPSFVALEHMPDGTFKEHTVTRSDVSELYRIAQYREARLQAQEKQMGQILNNLNIDGWYSDSIDKSEVLRDLCEIMGYTPQQEMQWSVMISVSGTTLVNLDEVEDFDIRYHLADNLSVDSNDFDTKVDSWDIDSVDSQDWE